MIKQKQRLHWPSLSDVQIGRCFLFGRRKGVSNLSYLYLKSLRIPSRIAWARRFLTRIRTCTFSYRTHNFHGKKTSYLCYRGAGMEEYLMTILETFSLVLHKNTSRKHAYIILTPLNPTFTQ